MPTHLPASSAEGTARTMRRILLALESAQDRLAFEAAAELASRLQAQLRGVFVENADLLRLAHLPFAHEITLGAATPRRLEATRLERDLRTQAEEARQHLAAQAAHLRLEWTFEVMRGALHTTLALADEFDVMVLGRSADALSRGGDTLLVAFDGTPGSVRALEIAAALDQGHNSLLLLLPASHAAEARATAGAWLRAHGQTAHTLTLPALTAPYLIPAARTYHCRALLLGQDHWPWPEVQQLLHKAGCPVVMTR